MAQTIKDAIKGPGNNKSQRTMSHGRGGAGNLGKPEIQTPPADFSTPVIKTSTYTTGRGGTGNMAINDPTNPAIARAAQDVEAPAHHVKEAKGTYHWGRGGEGNQVTVGGGDDKVRGKSEERRGSLQGMVEKGKEIFGLRRKDSQTGEKERGGSAVVDE